MCKHTVSKHPFRPIPDKPVELRMVECKKCGLKFLTIWKEGTIACPGCEATDELVYEKHKPSWCK